MKETGQFSIYKVDLEKVEEIFEINKKEVSQIKEKLLDTIGKKITNAKDKKVILSKSDFEGFLIISYSAPPWTDLIKGLIPENIDNLDEMKNARYSYLLFYSTEHNIYIMTGGYASKYVKEYTEDNYGINLVPKLVERTSAVLRSEKAVYLDGKVISEQKINRQNDDFTGSYDITKLSSSILLELDASYLSKLGLTSSSKRKTGISVTDQLVVKKSITLEELKVLLHNLDFIETKKSTFMINQFVSIKKSKKVKKQELEAQMVAEFQELKYENFVIVGDDYLRYCIDSFKYRISNGDKTVYESESPISLEELFHYLEQEKIKLTKAFLTKMLKEWSLSTYDEEGKYILFPRPLLSCLQGFLEIGEEKEVYYLYQNQWMELNSDASQLINEDFKVNYLANEDRIKHLKEDYKLKNVYTNNENGYNNAMRKQSNMIEAHTVLEKYIELADLIFWNESDETIYLMHNKGYFNGLGARDLANQMETAANYLYSQMATKNRRKFLKGYYQKIKAKYEGEYKETLQISENDFVESFLNKKICYIAGFIQNYNLSAKSNYGKFLTNLLKEKMKRLGYDFLVIDLS